ncbi:hypothetical protein EGS38_07875 [Neisseria chenwenguii]|nr:hypothetical protein EGS38_07875 [Neisseria chenwenguii]
MRNPAQEKAGKAQRHNGMTASRCKKKHRPSEKTPPRNAGRVFSDGLSLHTSVYFYTQIFQAGILLTILSAFLFVFVVILTSVNK